VARHVVRSIGRLSVLYYPERLFGVAMLPTQSVELAIDEMHYRPKRSGCAAGFCGRTRITAIR
jgi:hypothetical protein